MIDLFIMLKKNKVDIMKCGKGVGFTQNGHF